MATTATAPPPAIESGIVWAHRLLLNREPQDRGAIAQIRAIAPTVAALRNVVLGSAEFSLLRQRIGKSSGLALAPAELREGIDWGYRLILNREPVQAAVEAQLPFVARSEDIRSRLLLSRESREANCPALEPLREFDALDRLSPYCLVPGPVGSWNDFIGVRTRCRYLLASFMAKSATVEGPPGLDSRVAHDLSEWVGTIRSLLEAGEELVAIELGAGWAPWLVTCGVLAKRLGISKVKLIGVEASQDHLEFMRQHFVDNDLDPSQHELMHAVVGPEDGLASFPKLNAPREDYGAIANFNPIDNASEWETVQCLSLRAIMRDIRRIDILHCDIQGAELEVLGAARREIDQQL
jgi:FkbM family methyltransferase